MLIKRINKLVVAILLTVTALTPVLNSAYALESIQTEKEVMNIDTESVFSDIDVDIVEDYMKSLYGDEDKFVKGYSYENKFSEVNPVQGIIRINELNNSGIVVNTYDINMYENEFSKTVDTNNTPEERKSTVYRRQYTGSPIDKFSLAVYSHGNYNSDYRISIGNKNGTLKNYYKSNSWDTGATSSFKSNLISAQGAVSNIKNVIGTGALFQSIMSACVKFFGKVPILEDIKVILGSLGIGAATIGIVAPFVLTYFIKVRNCGSYYNQIIGRLDESNYLIEE